MGDGKLLREFAVEDGAVVNLMVKAGIPELTLTTDAVSADPRTPALSLVIPPTPLAIVSDSNPFSSPALWVEAHGLLRRHFGDDNKAAVAFEAWLSGSMAAGSISASEKAKIREATGLSAMGGV